MSHLQADTFRGELALSHGVYSSDIFRMRTTNAEYTQAFREVPAEHPLNEAFFLARIPYVNVKCELAEGVVLNTSHGPVHGALFRYADGTGPLTLEAHFDTAKPDYSSGLPTRQRHAGCKVGYFVTPAVEIGAAYDYTFVEGHLVLYRIHTIAAYCRALLRTEGGRALGFRAELGSAKGAGVEKGLASRISPASFAVDYYFTKAVSFGATALFQWDLFSSPDKLSYRLRFDIRLGPRMGLGCYAEWSDMSPTVDEPPTLGFRLVLRR